MHRQYTITALLLTLLLVLSGCKEGLLPGGEASPDPSSLSTVDPGTSPGSPEEPDRSGELPYIEQVAQEVIARFLEPGMSEFEMAKAAFDYLIETTYFEEPIGLDLWRIRGNYGEPPSFVENRSLSILLFGVGECEDFAAALTMLLRGMGLEAEYVPGLTYSVAGALVDHAWTVAKVDGVWYHLDPQLEFNISKSGRIRYRYFMRGDTLVGSHRWGQNLIDSRLLTSEQNAEIAAHFIAPPCPEDYAASAPKAITMAGRPDIEGIRADIEAEFAAYEARNGPLEPMDINIVPPVFGYEGYGPQN